MSRKTLQQACVDAISEEMHKDANVFIMGEDIGKFGGPLKSTDGLWESFGEQGRVIDMPMSEGTIVGVAVGAAMQGKRPIVDLMFLEFLGLIMQQLMDAGAMHFYSGGHTKVPIVIRAKYGIGPFHGHAYDLSSWAANIPGIKIVIPTNPRDAKAMLKAAIRDDNPVLFLEHMSLYHAGKQETDEDLPEIKLSSASIAREGADISIIGAGLMVKRALLAAKKLEQEGIDAEVIDLRSIVPLDAEAIVSTVRKTGRALVLSEAIGSANAVHEVSSIIAQHAFHQLKSPLKVITAPSVPVPFHRDLEKVFVPDIDQIVEAAKHSLQNSRQTSRES